MDIVLEDISKKFGTRWIFRHLNFHFKTGEKYALTGPNGSGKSTLINILIGKSPASKGVIKYQKEGEKITVDNVFKEVSVATTSMSLIEEFTLEEIISFHFRFRKLIHNVKSNEIFEILGLEKERKKYISNFSSGMKQRLKIALALLSESSVLIFDEPGANLDENSKAWFQDVLAKYLNDRLLIIASNEESDYQICRHFLDISNYTTA